MPDKDVDRRRAWVTTRKLGFASFTIPVLIIVTMIMYNPKTLDRIWPLSPGSLRATLDYFLIWLTVEIFLNLFKFYICTQIYGMSIKDYSLIIGPRDQWSHSEIKKLETTYSMRKLKIMDAIYRRSGHIVVNFVRIYYYLYMVDNTQRLQVAILQLPIIFTIKKRTEFHWLGNFVYQGCRIRDGQYGRFNQVVVNFWAYCARIIMMILLHWGQYDEPTTRLLFALAMQPLIWGDTFGEIIGSFFGKIEFSVLASSFVSLMIAYRTLVPDSADIFIFDHWIVFLYTAFVSMIVEVGAPRSTDNFFLQTCGLILLLCSLKS